MIKMLYNRCTGIYKFGSNTYPWRIRRRSNLGHIFRGKKCVLWAGKYGILRRRVEVFITFKKLHVQSTMGWDPSILVQCAAVNVAYKEVAGNVFLWFAKVCET